MTNTLASLGLLNTNNGYESAQAAKDLVFAMLGWQTMLYKPDFSPPSMGSCALLDETDGHHGEGRLSLTQSGLATNKNLPDFLLGFGMMLPPPNYCAFDDADDQALFNRTRTISSKDLNAHVLTKVCGMTIQWVDSLSCHLELDRQSGKLFLYRYPSFCASSLADHHGSANKPGRQSTLHHCALENPSCSLPWGTQDDVTGLLQEILLSYRLIFGQNKRSRAAFRQTQPFARIPSHAHDRLLGQLCGRKRFDSSHTGSAELIERDEYDLAADFPHLRSRLARLGGYAAGKKPRSIRQLWSDRRDSTAWLALWSVLVFGSVSVVLAMLQTVFQVLQYAAMGKGGG